MREKIWNISKWFGRTLKVIGIVLFFSWVAISLVDIKKDIATIKKENTENYSVQAKLFSQMIVTITTVAKYSQNVALTEKEDVATLANFLQILANKIKLMENPNIDVSFKIKNAGATLVKQQEQKPAYEYMKSMIVYLIEQSEKDAEHGSIGTGTVIKVTDKETFILTNKHVCDWAEGSVCYVYQDKVKYHITLVKKYEVDHDMQIVKTSKVVPNKQAIKGVKDVNEQDRVFMVGNNNGNSFMYSEGTVSGFLRGTGDLLVGMPSGPGNSGSGIFTSDGYLAGLLYAGQVFEIDNGLSLDTSHGICVPSTVLRLFLSDFIS